MTPPQFCPNNRVHLTSLNACGHRESMMLKKSLNLAGEVLDTPPDVNFQDLGDVWHQIVLLQLVRSRQALTGVIFLSSEQFYSPAVVLCRYVFELAVNIRYLAIDPAGRVPGYLQHYRVGLSAEESDRIDQELQSLRHQENDVEVSKLLNPGRSWLNLKHMCRELGWLDQYETIYRASSERAHTGARTLGLEWDALVNKPPPMLEYAITTNLLTALIYHVRGRGSCWRSFPNPGFGFETRPLMDRKIHGIGDGTVESNEGVASIVAETQPPLIMVP